MPFEEGQVSGVATPVGASEGEDDAKDEIMDVSIVDVVMAEEGEANEDNANVDDGADVPLDNEDDNTGGILEESTIVDADKVAMLVMLEGLGTVEEAVIGTVDATPDVDVEAMAALITAPHTPLFTSAPMPFFK